MKIGSEAFRKYNFDEKASRLMGNFNLRYECSDARDDFAAQRRSQGDKSGYSLPLSDDTLDSLDEDHTGHLMCDHNEEENEDEDEIQQLSVIGEKAAHKLHEMNAMENLLQTIGWTQTSTKSNTEKVSDLGKATDSVLDSVDPNINWGALLQDKREEILSKRSESANEVVTETMDNTPMSLKSYAYYFLKQIHNVVKMVTKEYLDESFSFDCKEIRQLKENICCDFPPQY